MRLTQWSAIGYGLLAGTSFVLSNLAIVLIPTATVSILFFVVGIALFPRRSIAFAIHWPAIPSEENLAVVIDGAPYPVLGYEQELVLRVTIRNGLELLATVALAAVSLYLISAGASSLESQFQGSVGPYL